MPKPKTDGQTARIRTTDLKDLKVLAALNEISMIDTMTCLLMQFKAEHGTTIDPVIMKKVRG